MTDKYITVHLDYVSRFKKEFSVWGENEKETYHSKRKMKSVRNYLDNLSKEGNTVELILGKNVTLTRKHKKILANYLDEEILDKKEPNKE